eukprot:130145-Rhodomonas_salina.1
MVCDTELQPQEQHASRDADRRRGAQLGHRAPLHERLLGRHRGACPIFSSYDAFVSCVLRVTSPNTQCLALA